MVVVGGLSSAKGSILGTTVLYLLPEFIRAFSEIKMLPKSVRLAFNDYTWHLLVYGIILYIFVLFIPKGLAGILSNIGAKLSLREQTKQKSNLGLEGEK
jgi:branched-chain amino acid transport system permease protein